MEALNKHWGNLHTTNGQELDKNKSIIYDPRLLVQGITEGTTLIEDARAFSISIVESRALELGKSELWEDSWGRKKGKLERALRVNN